MKKFTFLLCLIGSMAVTAGYTQCRTFVKNNCGEAMGEYVPAENFNAAKLLAGDEAEVEMVFYEGEEYRLLVCNHEILNEVSFEILDKENQVLFNNTENGMVDHFDFQVAGTQELTIKLKVADNPNGGINPQGCVAIMVGRKIDTQ